MNRNQPTIHLGDALAWLQTLDTASADAIITDPPYSSGGMMRGDRMQSVHTKYVQTGSSSHDLLTGFSGDSRDQRGYLAWCALWMTEALRVVRPGGVLAVFTDWRQLPTTTDAVQAGGWVWRGVVPWHKPNGRPVQGRYANACEYVVWGTNGPRSLDELGGRALPGFLQANPPREREHITQKPLNVMRSLVRIAPPGGLVVDPFAGSGTTGVACIHEGRQFAGCESVAVHHATAVTRLAVARGEAVPAGEQAALDLSTAASPDPKHT